MKKIAVLTHLYYEDTWEDIKKYLIHMVGPDTRFYFNLCIEHEYSQNLANTIKRELKGSILIQTPNVGKDIGGKLALINLLLLNKDDSDYILFMHDKKSPHTSTGIEWRNELLSVAEERNFVHVLNEFNTNRRTGIIASKKFVLNEFDELTEDFSCTSNFILKTLKHTYNLKIKNHDFVGGTMFWVRSDILRNFFKKHSPLKIRSKLERGNVLDHDKGSLAHAWERMLSWIAINEGYTIKGL